MRISPARSAVAGGSRDLTGGSSLPRHLILINAPNRSLLARFARVGPLILMLMSRPGARRGNRARFWIEEKNHDGYRETKTATRQHSDGTRQGTGIDGAAQCRRRQAEYLGTPRAQCPGPSPLVHRSRG